MSKNNHLDICKYCGCDHPLGELPEKLTRYQMRIVMKQLNIVPKEIAEFIGKTTQSLYQMLRGRSFKDVERKLSDYLLDRLHAQHAIGINGGK